MSNHTILQNEPTLGILFVATCINKCCTDVVSVVTKQHFMWPASCEYMYMVCRPFIHTKSKIVEKMFYEEMDC